jgi:group I intron endonuclease
MTTNLVNGMRYIGKHHGEINDSYIGSGSKLLQDVKKFGKENFKKEILYISQNEEENCKKEEEFIAAFNAVKSPLFYNIHTGGSGGNTIAGYSPEERAELKKKCSERVKGEGNPMYGKHHSEITKQKIRENRDTSYMQTDEYRKNMSKATSGEKNGMYGKHHSEESKKLMSEHSKGKTAGEKNGMYGKSGNNALNGKKIAMYDKDMNLIQVFNAKTAVLAFLQIKGHTGLDKAIKEETLYKGYFWKNY